MILLLSLNHFAAAEAGSTHAYALGGSAHAGMHRTQVHIPAPLGDVMRVADSVSKLRLLAADFTLLCHDCSRSFQVLRTELVFYRIRAINDNPLLPGFNFCWDGRSRFSIQAKLDCLLQRR